MAEAKENTGLAHLEALVNSRNKISVWRNVSIFLVVIIVALLYGLIKAVNSMPVVLVPQSYSAESGRVRVSSDIAANEQYLIYVAEADLKFFTDWTPSSVESQYGRFLNRMAPNIFGAKSVELVEEGQKLKASGYSQTFTATSRAMTRGGVIVVTGNLVRWIGNEVILSEQVTYRMGYRFVEGRLPVMTRFSGEGVRS